MTSCFGILFFKRFLSSVFPFFFPRQVYKTEQVKFQSYQKWASLWDNLFLPYANNKGADQPAHPRSLISAFVVRCLDNTSSFYIQNCKPLASLCGCAGRFESYLVETPEDRFSRYEAQLGLFSFITQNGTLDKSFTIQIKLSPTLSVYFLEYFTIKHNILFVLYRTSSW